MFRLVIKGDLGFEVWQDIPEYEGLYQASTCGRIKNKKSGKILKTYKQKKPYLRINLRGKKYLVHTLIAATFLPKSDGKHTQVNHRDENKSNNRVENLEYCDCAYNNNFGTRNSRISNKLTNHPKKSKAVLQFDLNGNFIARYPSVQEAARITGSFASNICRCCNGILSQTNKSVWHYA